MNSRLRVRGEPSLSVPLFGQRSDRGQVANREVGDPLWDNELKWGDARRPMRLAIRRHGDYRE